MRTLRKALTWARGKPNVNEIIVSLRNISRQLERERRHLEREEASIMEMAVQARQAGHAEAYYTYASEIARFRKHILAIDKTRFQILRLAAHLKRAQASAQAGVALEQVSRVLGVLRSAIDSRRLVENVDEISRQLDALHVESTISEEAMGMVGGVDVSQEDVASVMAEIERSTGSSPIRAEMGSTDKIKNLEEAIESLERDLGV
ncbi:MAG: Snf7 family protein [Candidatus Thorarchaeota archaeon]